MKFWIEVSSEYRFQQKLSGESGLYAPRTTRYSNMLKEIKKNDVVFHYITKVNAIKREHGSTIIGISITNSKMNIQESRLTAYLKEINELPMPIGQKDLFSLNKTSLKLKKLLSVNFQRYLTEIDLEDSINILKIHPQNLECILKSKEYKKHF